MYMYHIIVFIGAILLTFGSNLLDSDEPIYLGKDNITDIVNSYDYVFVEYYSPQCGVCKRVAPHWNKLPKALKKQGINNVLIAQVDVTDNEDLLSEFKLSRTPSFLLFEKDYSDPSHYFGARHLEAFVYFLKKILKFEDLGSPAHIPDGELNDIFAWIFWRGNPQSEMETTFLGFFPDKTSSEYKVFVESILSFIDYIKVGELTTEHAEVFKLPTKKPSLVLYRDFDEGKNIYQDDWEKTKIVEWVKALSVPMVTKVDHDNLQQKLSYVGEGFLVHLFVNNTVYKDDFLQLKDDLLDNIIYPRVENGVLQRGNFSIGITDGEKYKNWLKLFELKEGELPSIAAFFPKSKKKYLYGKLLRPGTYSELGIFLDSLHDGELLPIPDQKPSNPAEEIINSANPTSDEL